MEPREDTGMEDIKQMVWCTVICSCASHHSHSLEHQLSPAGPLQLDYRSSRCGTHSQVHSSTLSASNLYADKIAEKMVEGWTLTCMACLRCVQALETWQTQLDQSDMLGYVLFEYHGCRCCTPVHELHTAICASVPIIVLHVGQDVGRFNAFEELWQEQGPDKCRIGALCECRKGDCSHPTLLHLQVMLMSNIYPPFQVPHSSCTK
eukprot:evm.model.scf_1826.2 EVM.evm.TU.scf_1826.2   scf_1826:7172-9376(-)